MSGELYGLSGPGQRVYQTPPESGQDDGAAGIGDLGGLIGQGLVEAIQGIFSGGGILGQISEHQFEIQQNTQDATQVLEGINARGVACIPNSYSESSGTSFKRARFHEQVGPLVNMQLDTSSGEFVLLSRGAYEAATRMQFSWATLTDARVYCDLVVRDPSGTQFYRAPFVEKTPDITWLGPVPVTPGDNYQTVSHTTNFTVPGPGYRVSVEVKAGTGRGILTGYGLTEFVVNKWSSETS